jgi:hypothetical protein
MTREELNMRNVSHARLKLLGTSVCTFLLAACASVTPLLEQSALRQSCLSLSGQTVGATEIGLPSGEASVRSPTLVAAGNGLPEHCQVLGTIAPRGANADPIRFQPNLPLEWNHKAVMHGGGGFNGVLISGLAALRDAPAGFPLPIARPYATIETDSGHDGAAYATDPAKFALNDLDHWVTGANSPDEVLIQVRNDTGVPFGTMASRPMCRCSKSPRYIAADPLKAPSSQCADRGRVESVRFALSPVLTVETYT